QHGGTGLGLAIVRQIIESQGGTVKVDSKVGIGTKIGFELPLYNRA
ncbi:MAG TPA: ATP-binding protein, partial [Desulfobacteria bacterium]|nr:ATP-binding protein [Desulfobacteria bacterium]